MEGLNFLFLLFFETKDQNIINTENYYSQFWLMEIECFICEETMKSSLNERTGKGRIRQIMEISI